MEKAIATEEKQYKKVCFVYISIKHEWRTFNIWWKSD